MGQLTLQKARFQDIYPQQNIFKLKLLWLCSTRQALFPPTYTTMPSLFFTTLTLALAAFAQAAAPGKISHTVAETRTRTYPGLL